jgi:hydroxymethylpyrimidine pyrophosphatase-like HAD family hydrolase
MLQWVGHPVVMENAHALLKKSVLNAKVAKSNAEEGVAHYLQSCKNFK